MEKQTPLKKPSKPSPWGNYFKEFLMIFLAISLGFFVENLREDMAEKDLERDLMEEVVENLAFDTLRYHNNYAFNTMVLANMDSLRDELKKAFYGKPNPTRLNHFAFQATDLHSIALLSTNAITELRNSGALRLIRNKALRNKLTDYYERKAKALESIDRPSQDLGNEIRLLYTRHFSMRHMDVKLKQIGMGANRVETNFDSILAPMQPVTNEAMHLASQGDIDHFISTIGLFQIQLFFYQQYMVEAKKAAIELMDVIRKEYHFD